MTNEEIRAVVDKAILDRLPVLPKPPDADVKKEKSWLGFGSAVSRTVVFTALAWLFVAYLVLPKSIDEIIQNK